MICQTTDALKDGGTRRQAILMAALTAVLPLLGCRSESNDLSASAAKGSQRTTFVDAVAWQNLEERSATIAFVPFSLSDDQRRAVISGRGVEPALSSQEPMLEIRIELKPGMGAASRRIVPENIGGVVFTFWHFDEPPAVIAIHKEQWGASPEIELVGLDGDLKPGGWIVGTVRSSKIHRNIRGSDDAYSVNLASIAQTLI